LLKNINKFWKKNSAALAQPVSSIDRITEHDHVDFGLEKHQPIVLVWFLRPLKLLHKMSFEPYKSSKKKSGF
jgi:hypothetical protein